MEGTVLHFDASRKRGIIRDMEGERYAFLESDWKSPTIPSPGMRADFVINGKSAYEVYQLPLNIEETNSTSHNEKERIKLQWPDIPPPKAKELNDQLSDKRANETTRKSTTNKANDGRKMNWLGALATITVIVTLYRPLLYAEYTEFIRIIKPFSWAGLEGQWMVPILALVAFLFYRGASRYFIRILVVLGIFGIIYGYYNAIQEYAYPMRGEQGTIHLEIVAYINLAACAVMAMAAFSRHYSPHGGISSLSLTRVINGCIEATGSYHQDYSGHWSRYSYLTIKNEDASLQAKRVLVSGQVDSLVSPGVCGTFIFTTQFFQKVLIGIKTDDSEVWYLPSSTAMEVLTYLFATAFFGFLTYATFVTVILIPFSPFLAIATVAAALGAINAPFRINYLEKLLKDNGFSLITPKKI